MATVAEFILLMKANTAGLVRGVGSASKSVDSFTGFVQENRAALTAVGTTAVAMGAAITGTMVLAAREASKFQTQMAFVSTMVENTDRFMGDFSDTVRDLAVGFGQSTKSLSSGLFDILSASVDAEDALGVLEETSKLATAGFTDVATTTSATLTAMNAFGIGAKDVTRISDVMFAGYKRGRFTIEQLSSNLGLVASSAATAGLSFEETVAAMANVTRGGIDASMAATALNGAILAMQTPQENARKAALELGIAFDDAAVREKGFLGVLQDVIKAAPTAEQMNALFPDRRAKRAINIMRSDMEGFAKDVELAYQSAGLSSDALTKATGTLSFKLSQLRETGLDLLRQFGEPLIPILQEGVRNMTRFLEAFRNLPPIIRTILSRGSLFLGFMTTLGGALLLIASRLPEVIKGIGLMRGALQALAGATSPITAVAVAVGLVGKALIDIAINSIKAKNKLREARIEALGFAESGMESIRLTAELMNKLIETRDRIIAEGGPRMIRELNRITDEAQAMVKDLTGQTISGSQEVWAVLKSQMERRLQLINRVAEREKEAAEDRAKDVKDATDEAESRRVKFLQIIIKQSKDIAKWNKAAVQEELNTVTKILEDFMEGRVDLKEEEFEKLLEIEGDLQARLLGIRRDADEKDQKAREDNDRKREESIRRWLQVYTDTIRAGVAAFKEAQDTELDKIKERKETAIEDDFEIRRSLIENAVLTSEERQRQLEALVEAEKKAKDAIILTDEEMAKSRKVGAKAMLQDMVDRVISEISAAAIGAITRLVIEGPLTLGASLLAIPAVIAAELGAKAVLQGVIGSFQRGGDVPMTGLYKLHKGETITPAEATAGATVTVNMGPVSIASDLDVENVANRIGTIVARNIRRRRGF